MYRIFFYDADGRWFSTATVDTARKIEAEIKAHTERWPDITWEVYLDNLNVTLWHKETIERNK